MHFSRGQSTCEPLQLSCILRFALGSTCFSLPTSPECLDTFIFITNLSPIFEKRSAYFSHKCTSNERLVKRPLRSYSGAFGITERNGVFDVTMQVSLSDTSVFCQASCDAKETRL